MKGQKCSGIIEFEGGIYAVDPQDAQQFSDAKIIPGDSIAVTIKVKAENADEFIHRCFANGDDAEKLLEFKRVGKKQFNARITCLGLFKEYNNLWDGDRGISYSPAFLIENITIKN